MRRRKGRSQAPKTGSPLLCSGGGGTSSCKRNGGNKPPSPTLPHLLLLLSALRTSVAPRSCAVNTSSVSTYYVPGTSNRKQSPLPWGASGDPGLSSDTGIMLFSTPQVCCVSEAEERGGGRLTTASKINKRLISPNTCCERCVMLPETKNKQPEISVGSCKLFFSPAPWAPICHSAFCSPLLIFNNFLTTARSTLTGCYCGAIQEGHSP